MKKNNIVLILSTLGPGGFENRWLELCSEFKSHFDVSICLTGQENDLQKRFNDLGMVVFNKIIYHPYLEMSSIMQIANFVKQRGDNIFSLNVINLKDLLIALIIKRRFHNRPKVVFHLVNSNKDFTFFWRMLYNFFLVRFIDYFICNSHFSKAEFCNKVDINDKIRIIYNGVNRKIYKNNIEIRKFVRENFGITDNEFLIGTVANFRPQKNYPFLITNFKSLLNENPSLRLICVGGGEELNHTKEICRQYQIEDKVYFTGYVSNVSDYINAMDLFVLCSYYEGLPNVLLQSMSIGIPVISSNVGGCSEIISDNFNGSLYDTNNSIDFLNKIKFMIDDEKLRNLYVKNGKRTVCEKFSFENMIAEYKNFYTDLSN